MRVFKRSQGKVVVKKKVKMAGNFDPTWTLKKEVASVLRAVPSLTLPLFKFREMFEKRYRRSVSSCDLYKMKDVVTVTDGSASTSLSSQFPASGRMISLLPRWAIDENDTLDVYCFAHPPKSQSSSSSHLGWAEKEFGALLPNVMIEFKIFSANLYSLLESHNGSFPLLSFLDCYESEFTPLKKVYNGGGVPLEHLISCVPSVEIMIGQNGMKRAQLVMQRDETEVMQPLETQLVQLSRELIELLKTFPRCTVPFARLTPAYHNHFGRQCRVADYGHMSLFSLLQTIPLTIQILGDTQNRVVTLCHRTQMKRFTTDVLRVLKAQGGTMKQVTLEDFPNAYAQLFSKPFVPEDYGLCYFRDLVSELMENSSLVILTNNDTGSQCLAIPKRGQTAFQVQKIRVFAAEVVDMLKFSVNYEMLFSKFIPSYHHHFGRQCRVSSFGFSKLMELLEAIPDVVEIICPTNGDSEDRIIRLNPKEQLKVIGDQVWNLVQKRLLLGVETHVTELEELFASEHGYTLKPELYGASDFMRLCCELSEFVEIRNNKIHPLERQQVAKFAEQTKSILEDESSMNADEFLTAYNERYNENIQLHDVERELSHLVIVTEDKHSLKRTLALAPIYIITKEIVGLLSKCKGSINIESFASAFYQEYGRALDPHKFGYTNFETLLEAIPEVQLVGRTQGKRFVTLKGVFPFGDARNNNSCILRRPGKNFHKHNKPPGKGSVNYNDGFGNSSGQRCSYPTLENSPKQQHVHPLTILTPVTSPTYQARPDEANVFAFDAPFQPPLSPPYVVRDITPSTYLWSYHPVVYPPPSPPGTTSMMTAFSFGGPWSSSPYAVMPSSACFDHSQK